MISFSISFFLELVSNFILAVIKKIGYAGVFFLMALESANIPIPSEIIMPFAGFALQTSFNFLGFWLVVFVGALGNLVGSLFSYWLGYLVRRNILHWNSHYVSREVERAKKWLDHWGDWAIFISRLIPVARTFISFPLGILKTKSFIRFSILTFVGSFIWSAFLAYLGLKLGENWRVVHLYFQKFDYLVIAAIIVAATWFLLKRKKIFDKSL